MRAVLDCLIVSNMRLLAISTTTPNCFEKARRRRVTNFDKVKDMSSEGLAKFLNDIIACCGFSEMTCSKCPLCEVINCNIEDIAEWLESEANND